MLQTRSVPGTGTFVAASLSVICAFAAASLPVTLMGLWTEAYGLTTGDIVLTVFVYLVGFLAALLFLARLSNSIGRRKATLTALIFGLISTTAFWAGSDLTGLLTGRFFQGLYCGVTSSAAMSWAIDSAPKKAPWLGTSMGTAGPGIGFIAGTLSAGLLMRFAHITVETVFCATLVLQAALAVLVWRSAETMTTSCPLASAVRPDLRVPPRFRRRFFMTAAAFIGCWALVCFFQGFSAMTAKSVFSATEPDALQAGIVYLAIVIPNTVGALAAGKLPPVRALPVFVSVYAVTGNVLFYGAAQALPAVFFTAAVIAGLSMGAVCSLSLKLLLDGAAAEERAPLISVLYLAGQCGTCIPNFLFAAFAPQADMPEIGMGFAVWFALVWLAVFAGLMLLRRHRADTGIA